LEYWWPPNPTIKILIIFIINWLAQWKSDLSVRLKWFGWCH
jgi:hypothetical protein